MTRQFKRVAITATIATLLPVFSFAQGMASEVHSLQGVLNNLYDQMIPLCSRMIGVGQGIAGFAALWYIAARVWKHIAAAEPVDFYPLLRPFAIGFCILSFPAVLSMINGVLAPTVSATAAMVGDSNQAIEKMLGDQSDEQTSQQQPVTAGNPDADKWYQYAHPDNSSANGNNSNPIADAFSGFSIKNVIRKWLYEALNLLFEAAALCIDTIRTFKLIVLAILGPLCFGLSVFDGFQHTLKQWLARYVNVYMWLPVANIFGAIIAKIQANMIQLEQAGGASTPHFHDTNTAYLIFLVIGIVGYFTVPGIANYIMNVGGHALFSKTSALTSAAVAFGTGQVVQTLVEREGQKEEAERQAKARFMESQGSSPGNYLQDKLSGNT